ncbi:hypothetical protein EC973_008855 [Apophysomyces ossiformis]|uniref:Uncharacterized protein n=1 Tax=Apophysomyces ossiformis TaxID=679940 RepID=A0A8H7BXD5_9FUNG|nr:hypothetical protein EC973_008855 [Apophysomyces ossiformis]
MNSLPFGSFHAKHFGQEQIAHWNHILGIQNQHSLYSSNVATPYCYYPQTYNRNDAENEAYVEEPCQTEIAHVNIPAQEESGEKRTEAPSSTTLSKEAIEIFRFSEAYKKERERLDKQTDDIEEDEENWDFNESSVLHLNGIEAPATCLVRTRTSLPQSNELRVQEHLLDSAYLQSCLTETDDDAVALWPVLPIRL